MSSTSHPRALHLAFVLLALVTGPAHAGEQCTYDDGGTLDWSKKLAEAQKEAKERRRLIFIEYGRES